MKRTIDAPFQYIDYLQRQFTQFALAPRRVLYSWLLGGLSSALMLILVGMLLHQPDSFAMAATLPVTSAPVIPADFTPVASPPPAFAKHVTQQDTPPLNADVPHEVRAIGAESTMQATIAVRPSPTSISTPVSLDALLSEKSEGNTLAQTRWVSILLMGTDARPDAGDMSRTDSMMVAFIDLTTPYVVLISIPRDLWVVIPGYGQARINTAYFLGQLQSEGSEVARETVSQLLGIPIAHTMTIDFGGFRRLVDAIGGLDIDVPTAIDDPFYPDDSYGTFRLVIPEGMQHMDGERALQYARTRHGGSDLERARRQQAVLEAIRAKLLTPEQLPHLPNYLLQGASEVHTTLSLPDLFYLARFLSSLERDQVAMHVIEPPLLWDGFTADGQQVLLYDPYSLQQTVQSWLWEASEIEARAEMR
ncbi:MAG: LCP family protein [Chloroflexota bacterium]|nr:LCP family protein [Chloroflexota bacterium]